MWKARSNVSRAQARRVVRIGKMPARSEFQPARINGMPGFLLHGSDGLESMAVEVGDGAVVGIYLVRNPDKLRHLT